MREREGGVGREREIIASIKELHVANIFIFIFNGYSSFLGCFLLLFLHERDEVTNSFLHDTSRLDHLTSHMMYYDATLELTCGRNIFPEPNRSPTILIPWRGGEGEERKEGKVEVRRKREREREGETERKGRERGRKKEREERQEVIRYMYIESY